MIGGGPAGLMAAETLVAGALTGGPQQVQVDLYDAMPSVGRKFLLAGRGGLNITHAEPASVFNSRYYERSADLAPMLEAFGSTHLREWVHGLGIETFVGSSQRVFPREMKAAPLLRAWLQRLRKAGVRLHARQHWTGWDAQGNLRFRNLQGETACAADAVVLAMGGGSWPHLGSDGSWVKLLEARGIEVEPLRAANCGFDCSPAWTDHLRSRYAGQPLKSVGLTLKDAMDPDQVLFERTGEFVLTDYGIEGSLVYAASAAIGNAIRRHGSAQILLDLLPGKSAEQIQSLIETGRGSRSLTTHLNKVLSLGPVKTALLHECLSKAHLADPQQLARAIKSLGITLGASRPLAEAISSAGGIPFEALDRHLMLQRLPGVFCAGEMLDWQAPTGGYLLTASISSGRWAGLGVLQWLGSRGAPHH